MKPSRLLLPLLSFAAGVAVFSGWRGTPPPLSKTSAESRAAHSGGSGVKNSALPQTSAVLQRETRDPEADRQAEFVLTGLSAPPSMDEVLDATGLARRLRLAIWLQTAVSDDIALMLERCREIPDFYQLTPALWERWVEIDREAALKNAKNQSQAWTALAQLDPEAALSGADVNSGILEAIAQSDPQRAIEWLRRHPQSDDRIWTYILKGLTDQNPVAAAELVLKNGFDRDSGFLIKQTLEAWGKRDSAGALDWALHLKNGEERELAVEASFFPHLKADPADAMKKAVSLPPGLLRSRLMGEAAGPLALVDPAAAAEIVAHLPTPLHRVVALASQVSSLAAADPDKALSLFQELTVAESPELLGQLQDPFAKGPEWPGASYRGDKVLEAVIELARHQPAGVSKILADLPSSSGYLLNSAVTQWVAQDPEAASAWVNQLPAGSSRDTAVEALTSSLTQGPEPDYEAALAWSLTAPPARRLNQITETLKSWRRENPEAAELSLSSLPLTDEERTELTRRLEF